VERVPEPAHGKPAGANRGTRPSALGDGVFRFGLEDERLLREVRVEVDL
jgi:hypothetical protein